MPRATPVIHVLEHMDVPEPDAGLAHLAARGAELRRHRPDRGDPLPDLGPETAGLLVLGGPQMVTDIDALPWMQAELAVIDAALARGLPTLGICLGAQMISHLKGGRVAPHPKGEMAFGFHTVRALPAPDNPIPDGLTVLSGNAQGFTPPPGAEPLAEGAPWPHQAFRLGAALALQFHPEVTRPILDHWQTRWPQFHDAPGGQPKSRQDADFARHDPALKAWFRALLDRWFALA